MWRGWSVDRLMRVDGAEAERALEEGGRLARPIFNYREAGGDDDLRRRQLALPDRQAPAASALASRARWALSAAGGTPGDAVLLWSAGGCGPQAPHTDYDGDSVYRELLRHDRPPPEVYLVGLMDGTRLTVEDEDVAVPPGHVLRFDGRLVHAGAAYDRPNARLHFYAAGRAPDDRTYLV